jgi:hypothetical protein
MATAAWTVNNDAACMRGSDDDKQLTVRGVLGHVLWFSDSKGFGFIKTREHGDVFVHSVQKARAPHLAV